MKTYTFEEQLDSHNLKNLSLMKMTSPITQTSQSTTITAITLLQLSLIISLSI